MILIDMSCPELTIDKTIPWVEFEYPVPSWCHWRRLVDKVCHWGWAFGIFTDFNHS